MRASLAILLAALALPAHAAETTVLKAARLLDVAAGRIVSPAAVVVEGGRIKAVNPASLPPAAAVTDLGDVTLLPGLMDGHVHLTMDLEPDFAHKPALETAADQAIRGVRNARLTLAAGFTTVRNLGAGGFADIALKRGIDLGRVDGPDILGAGHSISITGGHCDDTGFAPGVLEHGPEQGVADGVDAVLRAVRYQAKHGAQVIKICATAGVLSFDATVGAQQMSDAEMRAAVEEAGRHGLKVAAHAHGAEGILAAVRAGVASIEHGSLLTDEIFREMKKRGTYLVPTTYLADAIALDTLPPAFRAKAEEVLPKAKDSVRRAIKAGVKVAFGTDAAVVPHGQNGREFKALVDRGMTPLEAIRSATVNTADLLGLPDRGRLAAGLRADLVAVEGNPLDDITRMERVRYVMKAGKAYVR